MSSLNSEYWSWPYPQEDELSCSILARFLRHWEHLDRRGMVTAALGYFPKSLHAIALPGIARLGNAIYASEPLPAVTFLRRHTLLPYFCGFLEKGESLNIELRLLSNDRMPITKALNLPALGFGQSACLRLCETCVSKDRSDGQEPCWRRIHQLPGISRCPSHGNTLLETSAPYGTHMTLGICAAEDALKAELVPIALPMFHASFEADVAAQSLQFLSEDLPHRRGARNRRFRAILYQIGYGSGRSNEIRSTALVEDFRNWLRERGAKLESIGQGPWWLRMSSEVIGWPTPLQTIVFRLFLDDRLRSMQAPTPDMFGFDLDAPLQLPPSRRRSRNP